MITFTLADWMALATHLMMMSLLSVGGAITTAPDLHRYMVDQQHWLSDSQFTTSIAIAQAAPGPNILFIALLGWNIGMNAAGLPGAALGVVVSMLAIMTPSSVLMYAAVQWAHRNRDMRAVRAFKQGMAPIVLALLVSTGWVLATGGRYDLRDAPLWGLALLAAALVVKTRLHILWLLGGGALVGAMGWM